MENATVCSTTLAFIPFALTTLASPFAGHRLETSASLLTVNP
jgi:hypothetical protein